MLPLMNSNPSSMPTIPEKAGESTPVDVNAFLQSYERPSYSDISLICCAVSSNIRTNRRKQETESNRLTDRLIPGIKPFFFHSLTYDPEESCRADEVIAQTWTSLDIEKLRVGVETRDQTDVQNH